MFELLGILVIAATLIGVVIDDELYRLLNTAGQFATIALLVWHQHHIKKAIEPEVKDTAAVVKRELGTRIPGDTPPEVYTGPERRKAT